MAIRRIVLCLDGTWNNTYAESERTDGSKVIKPSNVLKFARAVLPHDSVDGIEQIVYYDTGVGSMSKFPGPYNALLHYSDKVLGGGWGAGFESNIEDAITFLVNNYQPGDQVYICGFSRGAATARALSNFIEWMDGIPLKSDAFFIPEFLRHYVDHMGDPSEFQVAKQLINQKLAKFNQQLNHFNQVEISFLGVWDTVLSLGGRVLKVSHRKFHLEDMPANCIRHVRHALAIDEKRSDFLPAIWKAPATSQQDLKQRWFAGVHSNIGGGYVNDGLANITLRWMVKEIEELQLGLKFDKSFLAFYRGYPQDKLIESKTLGYVIKDGVLFRKGRREIYLTSDPEYQNSGLEIHDTAIQRMLNHPLEVNNNKARYSRLEKYRPQNIIQIFTQQPSKRQIDIDNFVNGFNKGFKAEHFTRIINGGDILFDAKNKKTDTGYVLDYQTTYNVSLEIESDLFDKDILCDFSGWNAKALAEKSTFHKVAKRFSRMPGANLFSLIGEVDGKKIDMGKLWIQAGKGEFSLCLQNLFPNKKVSGKLYVYLNDVRGFYRNNKGAYKVSIKSSSRKTD
ncbi:DUF2235 domain-containing protein [Aliikangiella coralliicola]|nr:DUF2235 domain-containing protein [Aliikangiella coralliicola]